MVSGDKYHHEICIHRWGWKIILHPDGTVEARSPNGDKVLRSFTTRSADP
jgi:hypothetical protein